MRYWPDPSVTAERTFSISAGLEASTVTPGNTAPEVSRTTPAIEAWANAAAGSNNAPTHNATSLHSLLIVPLLSCDRGGICARVTGDPECGRSSVDG